MTTVSRHPEPPEPRKPAGAAVLQADKTDAIVTAFYEELAEGGFDRLTMDKVAARAGVGKAALYRRWRSKEQMLAELVAALGDGGDTSPPDLGSLRADLHAVVTEVVGLADDPLIRQVIPYVIAMSHSSPQLLEGMHRVPGPSRRAVQMLLQRAIARGELAPDTDLELALDVITGPLVMRVFVGGEVLDQDYVERFTAFVLRALGAVTSTS